MSISPCLTFIESNTSGTGRLFARAAREQGFRPILITNDPSRYKYAAEEEIDIILKDTQNEKALLEECRRLAFTSGLAGITTSSEYYAETTAKTASRLGLPGPRSSAVRACRDKYKQRVLLHRAGCCVPAFSKASSIKGALTAAQEMGLPVILKPVNGSGSVGVRLCANFHEVASHAQALLRQRTNERGLAVPHKVLIESVAHGSEYSVEAFSNNIIGITKKYLGPLPDFVEVGHDYPAELSDAARAVIEQTALSALDVLGMTWGPVHVELRLTEHGPKIIEVNPRLAGGYIPELVRLSSGIDLIAETIRAATGNQPRLEPLTNRYASIRFILPQQEGTLTGVEGLDTAKQIPCVVDAKLYSEPGDKVFRRGDFRDRIGHVITCSGSGAVARHCAQMARRAIKVSVRQS